MAATEVHQHLYSDTPGAAPSSLLAGQIAVNRADRKLFVTDTGGAVRGSLSDGWQTYTPTVTADGGTFTTLTGTTGWYQVVVPLRMVFITVRTTITTPGTATGKILMNFPAGFPMTTDTIGVMSGRENGVSGKMLHAWFDTGNMHIGNYDDSSAIAAGAVIKVSGWYRY
jgi:hypothetical protein